MKRSRSLLFAFCALALTALLVPAVGTAAKQAKKDPKITVMSRNLYLGADLGPAIERRRASGGNRCGRSDPQRRR